MATKNEDVTKRFTPKEATPEGLLKLQALRESAIEFTEALRRLCPDNDRRRRAEEQVEIGVMLAAKSITHN